jgi:hypothetical protein
MSAAPKVKWEIRDQKALDRLLRDFKVEASPAPGG